MTQIAIKSDTLTAEISHLGAELQSLRDASGRELMSDGDPAFWTGRAPLLFPIVGRLNGNEYRIDSQRFTLEKHGFARVSRFEIVDVKASEALFRLTDSDTTRLAYPFAFELDAHFRVEGATLAMRVTVRNAGNALLPASFGYHPAFAWPLPFGGARADHEIIFAVDEPAPLCSINSEGLIGAEPRPSPVAGRKIALTDALFTDDALVWKDLKSRRLVYGAPGFPSLSIDFPDTEWLGIWTKPGAAYVCVEPWAGMADPEDFAGDFRRKPGVFEVEPGSERTFRMNVTLTS